MLSGTLQGFLYVLVLKLEPVSGRRSMRKWAVGHVFLKTSNTDCTHSSVFMVYMYLLYAFPAKYWAY